MDPLDWDDFINYNFIDQNASFDISWPDQNGSADNDISSSGFVQQENENMRKRARSDSGSRLRTKSCREKLRRERLNDRFLDLSYALEPGRPARTDKPTILDDAIRVLNQLRTEAQELREANEKLQEEVKSLKAEKNELRDEKFILKADKEKIEKELKATAIPTAGFAPTHAAACHPGLNKMPVYPSYGLIPMWQYLPPSSRDTSHDHELRPPAA